MTKKYPDGSTVEGTPEEIVKYDRALTEYSCSSSTRQMSMFPWGPYTYFDTAGGIQSDLGCRVGATQRG